MIRRVSSPDPSSQKSTSKSFVALALERGAHQFEVAGHFVGGDKQWRRYSISAVAPVLEKPLSRGALDEIERDFLGVAQFQASGECSRSQCQPFFADSLAHHSGMRALGSACSPQNRL